MYKHYVYVHIDSEDQTPFYIGVGAGDRAFDKKRNRFWQEFVNEYSPEYQVEFIAKDVSESVAHFLENYFIAKLGKAFDGSGCLLNWTDGGYAEGAYIQIPSDTGQRFAQYLTEYGKYLNSINVKDVNTDKVLDFINGTTDKKAIEIRRQLLDAVVRGTTPKKPWVIPFCVIGEVWKSKGLEVKITNQEGLVDDIKKRINTDDLPQRPYVDFLVHRIMIYFDVLLQEHVWLEQEGVKITTSNPNWYFYNEYQQAYLKIIQAINKGHVLLVKYLRKNKRDREGCNIFDFEVSLLK